MKFLRTLLKGKGKDGRRGSILIFALFLLIIAGIAAYTVTDLVNNNLRSTVRAESRLRAFYAAESGVDQVSDWFNRSYYTWLFGQISSGAMTTTVDPATLHTWTKDGNPFNNTTFQQYFSPWGDFTDLTGLSNSTDDGKFIDHLNRSSFGRAVGQDTLEITLDAGNYQDFLPILKETVGPNKGTKLAWVKYLKITRAPDNTQGIIAHVTALGINPSDAEVTVECDLQKPLVPSIVAKAALMGETGASSNGQINVHWGQVWTKGNYVVTKINGTGALPNPDAPFNDKWIKVLSESNILSKANYTDPDQPLTNATYCDGLSAGGTSSDPVPSDSPDYLQPYNQILQNDAKAEKWAPYTDVLYQHQSLEWPHYDYAEIKALVARLGYPIYKTTSDGYLIGPDPYNNGAITENSFDYFFDQSNTLQTPDNIDFNQMPPLYFIDTIDGKPPAADGSNVATLKDAGNKPLYYGLFFIAANMTFNGSGNSPSLSSPERPDRTIGDPIANSRFNGLLYSYGQVGFSGQGDMYGAVYAKNGFVGGGSWELYYDWRMEDPLRNMVAPPVVRAVWNTYNGEPPYMNATGSGS